MSLDNFESKKFIETVRNIVEKNVTEMFSLEDIDRVSYELELNTSASESRGYSLPALLLAGLIPYGIFLAGIKSKNKNATIVPEINTPGSIFFKANYSYLK